MTPAAVPVVAPADVSRDLYIDLLKKSLTASLYEESGWVGTGSATSRWAKLLHRFLQRRRLAIVRTRAFDETQRREGRDWPLFGYTMAGHLRLDNLQHCVEDVLARGVPGDFIETGTWRGGSAIFMRALLRAHGVAGRTVWVADSFEGMPRPADAADGYDYSDIGYLAVSLPQVQRNFARFGLLDDQVKFLKGWFADTLPKAPVKQLAILRLDGDMYSSTMDALVNLYDKLSPGGYVIVDDYYSWPSCKRAVTEFLATRNATPEILPVDWTCAYWRV